ncbi:SDR family NAD(P)-dependent oxidoreductase [Inquilinus limosus]|uniref:Short-chain dehydrogenase n=1 Tax=Inquilinus limosus MP06 TaxID=1398085 RepID=A0A0A0CWY6_9PROT|nr:SDR family oxidoreductase [Inquilinus limosus]KGM30936.1 short-chain dehydrogenase [Inquilinus limosus MP06]
MTEPDALPRLGGQVALVTGASRGIGAAAARVLAAQGAAVALTARSAEAIEAIARELTDAGGRAVAIAGDIGDIAWAEALVEEAAEALGAPTILVNNAGMVGPIGRLLDCDPADWARNVTVNLLGAHAVLRAALPGMVEAGGGTVINVSSGAAENAYEGWSAYCAGKAGLAMLTRSLHLEYGGQGIRAFGFRPGTVDTEMQGEIRASGINPVSQMPREAHAPPEHPARVIAWLCGPGAQDLVGEELSIRDPELRRRTGLPVPGLSS